SLTGVTSEELIFMPLGAGAAGMTTFVEAVKAMLGDGYAAKADFDIFCKRQSGDSSGPRGGFARLANVRFVASVEANEERKLAEGLVKQVSGGDTITASFLYHEAFEYRPQFKLWLAANQGADVNGADY